MQTHLEIDTIKKVIQKHKLSEEIIDKAVDNHNVERPTSYKMQGKPKSKTLKR